jgi:uncharacterized protein
LGAVIDSRTIELAASRISEAAGQHSKVILFGSYARGEGDQGSDIDFLVIEPEVEDRRAESVRLRRALRGILAPIDIIVVSEHHVRKWGEVPGTVIHAALAEGRVVHG